MERFQKHYELAKRKFQLADHMLNITYPLLRDTKLLLATAENLFLSLTNAMASILHFERLYKRIPPFSDSFESKVFIYERVCQDKFNLDNEYLKIMKKIKKIIIEQKKSAVVFSKNDKYVICSDTYNTMVLTYPNLKEYVNKAKIFIQETNSIINRNKAKNVRNTT